MIHLEHVTKAYEAGSVAVDDLTLEAPTGRITVLVGPSGCGKTTTLRMINRMVEPTSGTITVDGQDVMAADPVRLRRGIGYVIQHAGLFPHQTVERNIAAVPELLGWSRARARARSSELLELVGLDPALARRYPAQLSGGQQQRVGVARALAADPPVLLMDEPFSAVDPVVREQLQQLVLHLQEQLHKTIVLVTHDIEEALRLGDQVAVLRVGGHLAQVGSPEELLSRPADDFVAGFLGRDRGFRALAFVHGEVPVHAEPTLTLDRLGGQEGAGDGWVLVTEHDGRPLGWARAGQRAASAGDLYLGGTLAGPGASLRELLDAALSSPSRRGVVVDADGRVTGTVRATEVLRAIEAQPS